MKYSGELRGEITLRTIRKTVGIILGLIVLACLWIGSEGYYKAFYVTWGTVSDILLTLGFIFL